MFGRDRVILSHLFILTGNQKFERNQILLSDRFLYLQATKYLEDKGFSYQFF